MTTARPPFLHIANGSSTTRLITQAGIPGETWVWADPLHDGPVPAGLDADALRAARARHLSRQMGAPHYEQVLADLASWPTAIARSAACDELVLWFEHDLFDQLNLIQLLEEIDEAALRAPLVSLICIGAFPGRPAFKGLGELAPADLASLLEARQPVDGAQYALARRAWRAFRATTPREIEQLLEGDLGPLPFLGAALRRHLEEFPSTRDGLSRTERRLLDLAAGGPTAIWDAFAQVHADETAFFIGDAQFLGLAMAMAAAAPPLLTLGEHAMQTTSDGLIVLGGAADRVAVCGVDRWLGGVHLEGRGPVWRWDEAAAAITRA